MAIPQAEDAGVLRFFSWKQVDADVMAKGGQVLWGALSLLPTNHCFPVQRSYYDPKTPRGASEVHLNPSGRK